MERVNVLTCKTRAEFRAWLQEHHGDAEECYLELQRGRPKAPSLFWYLDAIEEALCFGWVDSTVCIIEGKRMQRFSPRRPQGNWTELNKERVRRLDRLGLMTDAGKAVLPKDMETPFKVDPSIQEELQKAGAWEGFLTLPPLYQRVRASNLMFYKKRNREAYLKMLAHTCETARQGKTFGDWNDYGRLLEIEKEKL